MTTRPIMRGYIHLTAALIAPFALALLLVVADSPRDFVSAAVFGVSLILLYTVSAFYHLGLLRSRYVRMLRRIDHAMIFLLIGGTYTPFALKMLDAGWDTAILSVVWGLAGAGILLKLSVPQAPRWFGVGIYLALGWIGLIPSVQISKALPMEAIILLVAGGLLYSAGGLMYLFRWPDLFPRVFGFHEVFHSLVVIASGIFYIVVVVYVLPK